MTDQDRQMVCTRRRSVVPLGVDGSPQTTTILLPLRAIRLASAARSAAENISAVVRSFFTCRGYTPQSNESLFMTGVLYVNAMIGTEDLNLDTLCAVRPVLVCATMQLAPNSWATSQAEKLIASCTILPTRARLKSKSALYGSAFSVAAATLLHHFDRFDRIFSDCCFFR